MAFQRSNRTFMELKYLEHNIQQQEKSVLIVPLWNWNFVALKDNPVLLSAGSNRTFMELKFSWKDTVIGYQNVLIVPLWNWNTH